MQKYLAVFGDDTQAIKRDLIALYLSDVPDLLTSIRTAISHRKADQLHQSAHKLKGNSKQIGASKLAALCQILETMGQQQHLDHAADLIACCDEEFARVRTLLSHDELPL